MGMTTEVIVRESNSQNNITSNVNIEEGHFSHFGIIEANSFRGFKAFGNNNNNPLSENNNNNHLPLPPLLLLPRFEGGLKGGFNPSPEGNAKGLDLNIAVLVNALAGANLRINHVERESNHIKPTEFGETEAENPNKWLE